MNDGGNRADLRVGTLNLWGKWADWPGRRSVLVDEWPADGPDVLMLQEVVCDAAGDQAEELAGELGYDHVEQIEGHRHADGREGLAILSRLPLRDTHAVELAASDPGRRLLAARLDTDAGPLHLACAHTVAVPPDIRMRQILDILRLQADPLVIGADLNEVPAVIHPLLRDPALLDCLDGDADPTWPMCPSTFSAAWEALQGRAPHFSLEPRRLDYLLARSVDVLAAGVHPLRAANGTFASDHALVWADVRARVDTSRPAARPPTSARAG